MANTHNSGTLNIAITAAREAGRALIKYSRRLDRIKVRDKGRNEFVSDADNEAENIIIDTIRQSYPDHIILAEEKGEIKGRKPGYENSRWIIDPLDGTTNFLHQIPQYCVSIAYELDGKLQDAHI